MASNWFGGSENKQRPVVVNGGAQIHQEKSFLWKIYGFDKIAKACDITLIAKQILTFSATAPNGEEVSWQLAMYKEPKLRHWIGMTFGLKDNKVRDTETIVNLRVRVVRPGVKCPMLPDFGKFETGAFDCSNKRKDIIDVINLGGDLGSDRDGVLTISVRFTLYSSLVRTTSKTPARTYKMTFLEKLCDDMVRAFLNVEEFSDFTLICSDKKELRANRAILAARSPVFRAMFEADMKESAFGVVEITDISSETMALLLQYIYSGSLPSDWVKLPSEQKDDLARAADKYELLDLFKLLGKDNK